MSKPTKFLYVKKLTEAMPKWERALSKFREKRNKIVALYVGKNYGHIDDFSRGDMMAQPSNYLRLATDIYARSLAAKNPKVRIKSPHKAFRPSAFMLEHATNEVVRRMKLRNTLRSMVKDALFCMGVVKVGVNPASFVELEDSSVPFGQPYADIVSLDDLVVDMGARRWSRLSAIGDAYFVPMEVVRESRLFDKTVRESDKIKPAKASDHEIGKNGEDRLQTMSRPSDVYPDEVKLYDLYLPQENGGRGLLLTLADGCDEPLREVEWEGPPHGLGPYHCLGFADVPDQLLPSAPATIWAEIQVPINVMMRKVLNQARRQKSITMVRKGSIQDGEAVRNASDGDIIAVDDPKSTTTADFGGPSNVNTALVLQLEQLFSYMAGNLDTLGGLSAQSDTVGQEQLLAASASKVVADMQDRFVETAEGIVRSIAYHIFYDPAVEIPFQATLPNARSLPMEMELVPGKLKGDFFDYNLEIEPYSMAHSGPTQELGQLRATMAELGQLLPLMQQKGLSIDVGSYLEKVAQLSNVPVDELVDGIPNPSAAIPAVMDPIQMPGAKDRTVTRVNKPAGTRLGRNAAMQQTLLGGKAQPSEMAALSTKG